MPTVGAQRQAEPLRGDFLGGHPMEKGSHRGAVLLLSSRVARQCSDRVVQRFAQ
jgi:hypothetical protein